MKTTVGARFAVAGANEGFYEDLVRQNTVARLFQRQLSASSHMGFSHRRSVLKATI